MESFENRVDKAFGSLGMPSSWRLSEDLPRSSVRPAQEKQDSVEEEEEEEGDLGREEHISWGTRGMDFEGDVDEEGQQMRFMIGLDATLDFEEEEDEFDKAAFGLEGNDEERLYMVGIKEGDKKLLTSTSLPLSLYDLKKVQRDPRANHSAARARLEEDARETAAAAGAASAPESGVSDVDQMMKSGSEPGTADKPHLSSAHLSSSLLSEKGKPPKRVRFALDHLEEQESSASKGFVSRPKGNSNHHASKVPDYVRNPSKYTCYTLDWGFQDNEVSNVEASKACNEIIRNAPTKDCSSLQEEMPQKIQYVHRPGRGSGSVLMKLDAKETNQSAVPTKRTMFFEHSEIEIHNGELPSEDLMDASSEETVSGFHIVADKKSKNYRSKRGAIDHMEN